MRSIFFGGRKPTVDLNSPLLPRDLAFSNTNRVPWGKQPVPSQSLGTERQPSSGRYFYLDNSSGIKHLGGRPLICASVTVPLYNRDKAHIDKMDIEKALLPLVTNHGCPTRFAADHHHSYQCSDIFLALLPVKRCLICGSQLIQLWLCGCTFSEMGSFQMRVVFWLCTAPLCGGQRLGNSQGDLRPNTSAASESFMEPFSCTFFQHVLAGHCLTMHSYSNGTTLNGDRRLLCRAAMPRRTTTEPPQPGSQGLGDQRIWLMTAIFCSTQPQALVLGEDVSSLEALPGQKSGWSVSVWAAIHGESEVGLQISRSLCQLWSFCACIVCSFPPRQSRSSCKASLDTKQIQL